VEIDQQTLNPDPLPLHWKMAWAVFFLALWGVGLSLQNPGLMADDSGEMVAAAFCLGLPHPPGYPFFTLLGHLACGIPLGSPAFRLNLLSMAFTFSAAAFLVGLFRSSWPREKKCARRETVFAICVLFLLTLRVVVAQSLTAKGAVYTLVLLLSVMWMHVGFNNHMRPSVRFLQVAFLWGFGLTVHWPTVLLWGLGLVLLGMRSGTRGRLKEYLRAMALSLVPLSLFLYLPLRASASVPVLWGFPRNLSGFLWVVRREFFWGTEPILRDVSLYGKALGIVMKTLCFESIPLLAVLGLGVLAWHLFQRDTRVVWLAVSFLPVFLGILAVPRAESFYLLNVYVVSLCGALTFGVFWGLKIFSAWRPQRWVSAVLTLLLFLSLVWGWKTCEREDKSRYTMAGDLGANILQALPANSFFLAEGDISVFPIWYSQAALGLRRDVAMVPSQFFLHPWGWAQAVRMRPVLGKRDFSRKDPRVQWDALREAFGVFPSNTSGGLYLAMDRTELLKYDPGWVQTAVPAGLIFSSSTMPTSIDSFLKRERVLRQHRRLRMAEEPEGSRGMDWVSQQVLRYYADESFQGALWLEEKGDLWDSLTFFNEGFQICSNESSAYSSAARVLGKAGYPEASVDLCRKGLGFDSRDVVLQNNLRFSLHLAAMETREGKTERYAGLLLQARKFHWEFLLRSFKETADRLSTEKGWTQYDGI
jgi:hypothetical protein